MAFYYNDQISRTNFVYYFLLDNNLNEMSKD
jgi:hypothetical protein